MARNPDGIDAAAAALDRAVRALAGAVVVSGQGSTTPVARIHDAAEVRRLADHLLAVAVEAARADGATWAQVGEALGTTRQAAFQRFGRPVDPRTGEPMNDTVFDGAGDLASQVFTDLADTGWERVCARFDETMTGAMSADRLADTWAQVIGTVGAYEGQGEAFVRRQGPVTVVDLLLRFEAGDLTGRVSFRDDGRIAGLFVLSTDPAKES